MPPLEKTTACALFTLFAAAFYSLWIPVALALSGCAPEPVVPPTYNPTSCAEACTNARAVDGPGALKPKTGTCEDACRATEENGGDFRTGCISAAKTHAALETCSR